MIIINIMGNEYTSLNRDTKFIEPIGFSMVIYLSDGTEYAIKSKRKKLTKQVIKTIIENTKSENESHKTLEKMI